MQTYICMLIVVMNATHSRFCLGQSERYFEWIVIEPTANVEPPDASCLVHPRRLRVQQDDHRVHGNGDGTVLLVASDQSTPHGPRER